MCVVRGMISFVLLLRTVLCELTLCVLSIWVCTCVGTCVGMLCAGADAVVDVYLCVQVCVTLFLMTFDVMECFVW